MKIASDIAKGFTSSASWEGLGAVLFVLLVLAAVWWLYPPVAPDKLHETIGL